MGAVTSSFGGLDLVTGLVTRDYRFSCSGLHGCLRVCGACRYGDRDHSTVLCRF